MKLRPLCSLWLGAIPFVLGACTYPGPAVAEPVTGSAALGVDFGGSARIPRVAALTGEHHPTAPNAMPGMEHGSMAGMPMEHGAMPGMSHSTRGRMQMAHEGDAHAKGAGTVNSLDASAHKINISHGPIPAIGFPAMTMDFGVAPSVDLRTVQLGARINFTVEQGQGGMYVIQSITPAGGGRK